LAEFLKVSLAKSHCFLQDLDVQSQSGIFIYSTVNEM
jgi:hypothetical protein